MANIDLLTYFLRLSGGQILRRKGGVFVVCVVVAVFWGESF